MDECPHCGEPIDEDALSCPHCGSDFETGWNPDADYYSVELPDDDLEDLRKRPAQHLDFRWERLFGWILVLLAALLFLVISALTERVAAIPLAVLLAVCFLVFYRWLQTSEQR